MYQHLTPLAAASSVCRTTSVRLRAKISATCSHLSSSRMTMMRCLSHSWGAQCGSRCRPVRAHTRHHQRQRGGRWQQLAQQGMKTRTVERWVYCSPWRQLLRQHLSGGGGLGVLDGARAVALSSQFELLQLVRRLRCSSRPLECLL